MVHGEDPNEVVSSHPLTSETTKTRRTRLIGTLTCPPEPQLPTLPFDVLPDILCRLPVKLLVQLRCLCKFFNSLITDPKFAKKHLQLSTKRHHLMVINKNNISREYVLYDSPISLVFSTSTVVTQTQLYPPNTLTDLDNYVTTMCSCDGIFCGQLDLGSYFLWNPSIRKSKLLPPLPLEILCKNIPFNIGFGYDHFIDNYKVIVVFDNNEVFINTLGTDYWRIEDFPYDYDISPFGIFVSDTVNWMADDGSTEYFIISLDLVKESYQELLLPDFKNETGSWRLGVVSDCLCVFATSDMLLNVWIMKEYGNQESWTKLYTLPNMQDQGFIAPFPLYISEDDQLLVEFLEAGSLKKKLVVCNSKLVEFLGCLNMPDFQNNDGQMYSKVYIESLISP